MFAVTDLRMKACRGATTYLVNVLMSYRKGEGETERKLLVLDMMSVQKVGHTLCYVVEQLQREGKGGHEMWKKLHNN